jgi:hypothetical protein
MNAKQYEAALRVSTEAALRSGEISLPEILGHLQLAAINAERACYQHAVAQRLKEEQETVNLVLPPNGIHIRKR